MLIIVLQHKRFTSFTLRAKRTKIFPIVVGENCQIPTGFQPVGQSVQLVGRNLPTSFQLMVILFS